MLFSQKLLKLHVLNWNKIYNNYITISVTTTIFYTSKFDTDTWQTQENFTIMDL